MTILYEYTAGNAPLWWFAITCWTLALIITILVIISYIYDKDASVFTVLLFTAILIGVGFANSMDTRHQEVKALIDNNTSFTEINEKYEFVKQEGDIYIFRVKNSQ